MSQTDAQRKWTATYLLLFFLQFVAVPSDVTVICRVILSATCQGVS